MFRYSSRMKTRPIRLSGDLAYVPLTRGYEAVIDAADAPLVSAHNWYALHTPSGKIYAARTVKVDGRYRAVLMHRLIVDAADDVEVDHHDVDGLNNRRANLRECTHQQNMANQVVKRGHRVGLKGVTADKGRFRAKIQVGAQRVELGHFDDAEEAGEAYRAAARKIHGKFAR
jgi:hypothetical protein